MPPRRPTLLAVFAHPDDETFLAGGTLALYASRGWRVRLVCATRGEAGRRGDYTDLTREQFARVRQGELEAACRALGIDAPRFLACADREVEACRPTAGRALVRILARLRPDIVVTFGPDGISGHPDHVAIGAIVTTAVEQVSARVGLRAPAAAPSLYYVLRSAALPPCCTAGADRPAPPVTTRIDIAGVGERKLAAVRCYESQRHLVPADEAAAERVRTAPEAFHRARPAWTGGPLEVALCPDRGSGEVLRRRGGGRHS